VDRLLDHPAYEPRMAAMCVLDDKARRRLDDDGRAALYGMYMGRHDRITTWRVLDILPTNFGWVPPGSYSGHKEYLPGRTPIDDLGPMRRGRRIRMMQV
jgi:hypothetical protein